MSKLMGLRYRDVKNSLQDNPAAKESFAREVVELLNSGNEHREKSEFYIDELDNPGNNIREVIDMASSPNEVIELMECIYHENEECIDYRSKIDTIAAEAYYNAVPVQEPELEVSQSSP